MDRSKLATKPAGPNISGNYTRIWLAVKSEVATMPYRNASNTAEIVDDIVFNSGKAWIPFYSTARTSKLNEKGSENYDNDNVTSTLTFHIAGIDEYRMQFLNELGTEDFYALIQKCGWSYPRILGDHCSYCKLTWEFDEDESPDGKQGVTITLKRDGAYLAPYYKGSLDNNNVFAADDATPTVADGSIFMTGTNTVATAITNLDNAIVGQRYTILGGGGTNASTIADGGNFTLSSTGTWTGTAGSYIVLFVRAANDIVELERG